MHSSSATYDRWVALGHSNAVPQRRKYVSQGIRPFADAATAAVAGTRAVAMTLELPLTVNKLLSVAFWLALVYPRSRHC